MSYSVYSCPDFNINAVHVKLWRKWIRMIWNRMKYGEVMAKRRLDGQVKRRICDFFAGLVFPGLLISVLCQPELEFLRATTGSHCLWVFAVTSASWSPNLIFKWNFNIGTCARLVTQKAGGIWESWFLLARTGCMLFCVSSRSTCRWSPQISIRTLVIGSRALMVFRFDA